MGYMGPTTPGRQDVEISTRWLSPAVSEHQFPPSAEHLWCAHPGGAMVARSAQKYPESCRAIEKMASHSKRQRKRLPHSQGIGVSSGTTLDRNEQKLALILLRGLASGRR